jgi:hypothetical protein
MNPAELRDHCLSFTGTEETRAPKRSRPMQGGSIRRPMEARVAPGFGSPPRHGRRFGWPDWMRW